MFRSSRCQGICWSRFRGRGPIGSTLRMQLAALPSWSARWSRWPASRFTITSKWTLSVFSLWSMTSEGSTSIFRTRRVTPKAVCRSTLDTNCSTGPRPWPMPGRVTTRSFATATGYPSMPMTSAARGVSRTWSWPSWELSRLLRAWPRRVRSSVGLPGIWQSILRLLAPRWSSWPFGCARSRPKRSRRQLCRSISIPSTRCRLCGWSIPRPTT